MKRRDFLRSSLAAAALAAAGCGGDFTAPPEENFNPRYPELHFITRDPGFSDYRPAVDATGERVVFERTPHGGGDTALHLAQPVSSPTPTITRFLPAPTGGRVDIPPSQTRPDWCWTTGEVALNGAPSNTATVQVLLVDSEGLNPRLVPDSLGWLYPIWTHDGSHLVVYNYKETAVPRPSTSLIRPDGTVVHVNMNGLDATGTAVFGGFAAPHPQDPTRIAYAGQPDRTPWGPAPTAACPDDPSGYNQCYNYPFLNRFQDGVFTSAPLEPGASVTTYDPAFQGRAPYWSPDGRYLLFESDRAGGYSIFLADLARGTPPVAVTDPRFQAQHAKFFPSGDRLVLTCLQHPHTEGPRGIAWIDISSFLPSP